jgi:hypothetical protein
MCHCCKQAPITGGHPCTSKKFNSVCDELSCGPPLLVLIQDWKSRHCVTSCGGRNWWINPRERDGKRFHLDHWLRWVCDATSEIRSGKMCFPLLALLFSFCPVFFLRCGVASWDVSLTMICNFCTFLFWHEERKRLPSPLFQNINIKIYTQV